MARISGTLPANTNIVALPADMNRQTITIFNHNNNHALYAEFDAVASIAGDASTFTASGATLSEVAHGLLNGEAVMLTTTDTLPAGLSTGITYYVVNAAADTYSLSLTDGGTAITTTDAGTGTHTATVLGGWSINHDDNSLTLSVRDYPEIRGALNLRAGNQIVYSVRTA